MDACYQYRCVYTDEAVSYGTVNVTPSTMMASHTPGTTDAGDVFALANGKLSVTSNSSAAAGYRLENGVLKIDGAANEQIEATANFVRCTTAKIISFAYDHNGLRTQKKIVEGSTTTIYDYTLHGKLITHLTKTIVDWDGVKNFEEAHYFYDVQSKLAFIEYGGNKYRYVYNLQGDIIALVNNEGENVIRYEYDAWGRITLLDGPMVDTLGKVNIFAYRGYVFESDLKCYYLNNRYYFSEYGRFLQMDSVLVHNNMRNIITNSFAYGNNTPVITVDNQGKDAVFITDTSSFTHSSVLIQNENNEWFYFYWGASKEGSSNNAVSNMGSNSSIMAGKGNVCIIYEKIDIDISDDEAEILNTLNECLKEDFSSKQPIYNYNGSYEKALYLKGDFSASHKMATTFKNNASNLTYSITSMNCAHAALYVLLATYEKQKNTKATNIIYRALTKMVPSNIHNYLAKKLPS